MWVPEGPGWYGGLRKLGERGQKVQTSVISMYWDVMYNMVTLISNTIVHIDKFLRDINNSDH